jgi:hypothetical protein
MGDMIALMFGRPKRRVSPTGSKVARTAAARERSDASEATAGRVAHQAPTPPKRSARKAPSTAKHSTAVG